MCNSVFLTDRSLGAYLRAFVAALALTCFAGGAEASYFKINKLEGVVEGNGVTQGGYKVTLYASDTTGIHFKTVLGTHTTNASGQVKIKYKLPPGLSYLKKPVLYVLAEKDQAMLASAIGNVSKYDSVVVNELTTVAIGTAFAQFIDGRKIRGNRFGVRNAVAMAANMADPKTGAVSEILNKSPNADETSTRATFYSMANIVASCIANSANCTIMFNDATPLGGSAPTTVLQALANMTKFPSNTVIDATGLFKLSWTNSTYSDALDTEPTSWLLFIKFTGGFYSAYDKDNLISGPGQISFDKRGFAWINDNYVPSDFDPSKPEDFLPNPPTPESNRIGCAGLRLLKFYPSGKPFPKTPYFGGGLSGAGFGITLDPLGKVWVGNFGFESPLCADGTVPPDRANKIPATHNSVSAFLPNGTPISGSNGFTKGHIWWPQGTVSDKRGNIWLGNCGNDTVTMIPRGKPWKAWNIQIPGGQGAMGNFQQPLVDSVFDPNRPLIKPFGVAIDPWGRAWVTGNAVGYDEDTIPTDYVGGVYRVSKDGTVETMAAPADEIVTWPMGIAGDSKGNMWVSNSDAVNVPCVTPFSTDQGRGLVPSVAYFPNDDSAPTKFGKDPGNTGGLTIPWGNFVDGNDTVWVFNFGIDPKDDESNITPVSQFCGADTSKCPPGFTLGQAISPETGYLSNALDRVTGGGVDRSGNVWILNNWKKTGPTNPVFIRNPGGNSFVIVPGAAGPIKTPLIGPPEGFDTNDNQWGFFGFNE
jgi:hypothetical protein